MGARPRFERHVRPEQRHPSRVPSILRADRLHPLQNPARLPKTNRFSLILTSLVTCHTSLPPAFHLAPSGTEAYLSKTYEKDTRTSRESHRRFRQWGPESVGVGRFYLHSHRRSRIGKNPATLHRHSR